MSPVSRANAALGYLYVRCSGVGLMDDEATRAAKPVLLVATWLWVIFFSIFANINYWIYDLRAQIEHACSEVSGSDGRTATLVTVLVLGAPAVYMARRVYLSYVAFARTSATGLDYLFVGVWYMAVVMTVLLNLNRYAAPVGLLLHAAFFAWLVFESKRSPLLRTPAAMG